MNESLKGLWCCGDKCIPIDNESMVQSLVYSFAWKSLKSGWIPRGVGAKQSLEFSMVQPASLWLSSLKTRREIESSERISLQAQADDIFALKPRAWKGAWKLGKAPTVLSRVRTSHIIYIIKKLQGVGESALPRK